RISLMRVNSSGVRLCFRTNSGVIAGSVIEQVGFRQRKGPQRIPRGRHEPTKRPPQRELFLENSGAGEGRFSDSFQDLATPHWVRERWGETPSSLDLTTTESRARRSLAPPGSRKAPFRFPHALGP